MISLRPITAAEFLAFRERSVRGYAEQSVRSGRVEPQEALKYSRGEFDRHLPEGLHTKGAHLFTIRLAESDEPIGHLWVGELPERRSSTAFIFDFYIEERHRRKGYGLETLRQLQERLQALGFSGMSLHVFSYNQAALNLYQRFGFQTTDVVMHKQFG